MALIIPHESQMAIQTASGGHAAQYRSAGEFSVPGMGQGLQQLAAGMDKLGGTAAHYAADRRQLENATDLLADKVAYQNALREFESNYRATRRGVDARTAEQDFTKFHQEQMNLLEEKWGGNPHIMANVVRMTEGLRQPSMDRAITWRDQQDTEHKNGVLVASYGQAMQIFADPAASYEEKLHALADYEVSLRTLSGQKRIIADSKPELPRHVNALVDETAKEHGVDSNLVACVVDVESRGNNGAVSSKGARGLMQLMPDTQKELEERHGVTGETAEGNIYLGVAYLKELLDRYEGDQELALMAYNWGQGNVDSYKKYGHGLKSPKNPTGAVPQETQKYVPAVLSKLAASAVSSGLPAWAGGKNVDAELLQIRQDFHLEHIESLIATDNMEEARHYFTMHSGDFGAKANNTKLMIDAKIEAADRKNLADAERNRQLAIVKQADTEYARLTSVVAELPLDEQQAMMGGLIAQVADPDVRGVLDKRMKADMDRKKMIQNANDMVLGRKFREYVKEQNLLPGQALVALEQVKGLSEKGREKLKGSLDKESQKPTRENSSALLELKRQIDLQQVSEVTEIDAFSFEHGLTDRQRDDALAYLNGGGNAAKVTVAKVEGIFKRMGLGKKMPFDFYEMVISTLEPGKPATDERIRQAIANLYLDGETAGAGWYSWGYGLDETYAEAVKNDRGKDWLPEVTAEEKQEISTLLRNHGIKVTEERIRRYKKTELLKIPDRSR